MKKMLLAGVAALSIASAAHATDATLPPADPLIGHWCRVGQGNGDAHGANDYRRGVWTCDGNLVIKPDGYDGRFVGSSCTFFDVRRSKNGWVTHADCDDNVYLSAEFKIVGKTLHYRELATGWPENGERTVITCGHVADNMSDGFLALRAGPGTHYIVRASLNTGDNLELGETTKNGWTSVSVSSGKGKEWVHGWVYHKVCQVRLRSAMQVVGVMRMATGSTRTK